MLNLLKKKLTSTTGFDTAFLRPKWFQLSLFIPSQTETKGLLLAKVKIKILDLKGTWKSP